MQVLTEDAQPWNFTDGGRWELVETRKWRDPEMALKIYMPMYKFRPNAEISRGQFENQLRPKG